MTKAVMKMMQGPATKVETIYKKRLEAPRHFYLAQSHALAEPFVLIIAFFLKLFHPHKPYA